MPTAAARPCARPGCAALLYGAGRYCDVHKALLWKTQNRARRESPQRAALDSQYRSSSWRRYSRHRLAEHPLCVICQESGQVTAATLTDHIVPTDAGGDFWDPENHQSLCDQHHRAKSGREIAAKLNGARG